MTKAVLIRLALYGSLCASVSAVVCGCSSAVEPKIEYYPTAARTYGPDPVYSRVTWSHLPQPIPTPAQEKAPYLSPVISFELPNSNLSEALSALSQTLGYDLDCPPELGSRKVSLKLVGTVDEVLSEINRQANVNAQVSHATRMVRVGSESVTPQLPSQQ